MTDIRKAQQEQQRISAIMGQISVIDGKISESKQVRSTLSGYKASLASEIESWVGVRATLNSDVRYTQIVTTDVFEGEMANRLKTYMSTVVSDINTGISDSENLLGALNTQISALEAYESRLSSQRAALVRQL